MTEKQKIIKEIHDDIATLNNQLHVVVNLIELIKYKLKKHGLRLEDIFGFDEKRLIALEQGLAGYMKRE